MATKPCMPHHMAFATLLLICACGRAGNADERPPAPPSADATPAPSGPPLAPVTNIGFEMLQTVKPTPVGCAKAGTPTPLAELDPDFVLGGALSRWPQQALLRADPQGDSRPELDIGQVFGGLRGQDFLAAVQTPASQAGSNLLFEFGGIRVKGGNLDAQVVREFRVIAGQLEERDTNGWNPVSSEFGQVVTTAVPDQNTNTVEIRLGLRMVADIMNWPIWWLRVSTRPGSSDEVGGDSISSRYFPSRLSGDEERYRFASCSNWGNDDTPFSLVEITDLHDRPANLDRAVRAELIAATENVPDGAPPPPVLWDFNSFGLVRRAFDNVSSLLGKRSLGIDQLTVIASLVTGDGAAGFSPNSTDTARYGYIFTESRRLSAAATDPSSFDEIFASAGMQLLRIYAASSGYAAPSWLQEAVAAALFNHFAETSLGRIYVLNRYRDSVSNYVNRLNEDVPLRQGSSIQISKATAFSHLLWANFDSRTLVNAWVNALAAFPAAANPDESFRASLLEAANKSYPGRANAQLLERIWAGWVSEEPYVDLFAPSALGDSDKDGLSDFLETSAGFSVTRADTDLDGLTDLVAFTRGGGAGAAPHPGERIINDGAFGDWTRLLPQRVNLHRGQAGICPESASISHFASLIDQSGMLIGAFSEHFPVTGNIRWEALIDLPEIKRQLLLTTDEGGTGVVVSDAVTRTPLKIYKHAWNQGSSTIEWAFRFEDLKLDPNQIKIALKNAVAVRLRTVYRADGKESYCDETNWFETNVVL